MKLAEWDSKFWGAKIGRADHEAVIGAALDCVWFLLPATDHEAIRAEEEFGARFMDFRVEYARDTGPEVGIARGITDVDVDELAAIARTAFRGLTRFYADPRFADSRCDDLYEGWFRENAADPDVEVLMVGDGGGAAGFVTVKMVPGHEASIVLIAVAEHARGRGMGENLTRAAVNFAYQSGIPRISVVTQGCNIASQRAFQAAGFRIESSSVWLHNWYV
jgi:dTDP-4-amino-4,6-dideoxy-D-galactose acyltransferase